MYILFLAGHVFWVGGVGRGDGVQQSESALAKGTPRYSASGRQ